MHKILIVDDEIRITEAFADALEDDYEVMSANDGKKAIEIIKEFKPDLLVLDWRLKSDVEGRDVLIFSKRELPSTPVVVVTASFHFVDEIKAAGADECILKPCAELKEKIKRLLSSR